MAAGSCSRRRRRATWASNRETACCSVTRGGVAADAFETVETRVRVAGLHPDPFRTAAYMDTSQAGLLGLEGLANRVEVVPAPGRSRDDVQRALFGKPGVLSVEGVTANTEVMQERMDEFVGRTERDRGIRPRGSRC